MARRGRGEGSFFQRGDGLWVGVISFGVVDGKRVRKTVYGSTKAEVREKVEALKTEQDLGLDPTKETVAVYLQRWLRDSVKPRLKATTLDTYSGAVEWYLVPTLGSLPLSKLTPAHVQDALNRLRDAGKSPRMQLLAYSTLRTAMKQAVGWRLIASNPVEGVLPPKYKRKRRAVWTPEQVEKFLGVAAKHRLEALFVLALTTAMREGEILGLQWSEVNLKDRRLEVVHTLPETRDGVQPLSTPKTDAGVRVVPLTAAAVDALRRHRERMLKEGKAACSYVFPSKTGTPIMKRNLLRIHHRLSREAGLPRITFHDLRHTGATLLRAKGLDMKLLQNLLGHSQFALTADTYSHVLPEELEKISDKMESVFGGGK